MKHAPMDLVPHWIRLALVALGVPNVATGTWAILSPQVWFDRFPGFDPRLVAAEPPFNAHLATDAGAGFLATGGILLLAAWSGDRRSARLALAGFGLFALPHAAYHALNPAPGLTGAEDVQNVVLLAFSVAVTGALLVVLRRGDQPSAAPLEQREAAA